MRLIFIVVSAFLPLSGFSQKTTSAEVIANQSLVANPVAAAFDDVGQLFVVDGNAIQLLIDTNEDGIYDASQVFDDEIISPKGVLWLMDSLFVASPSGIWRIEDTDNDGIADEREELVSAADLAGNSDAADEIRGPFLHPNGRIFWSVGKLAQVWSSRIDGSDVRLFGEKELNPGPFEIAITPEGEIISAQRQDSILHWGRTRAHPADVGGKREPVAEVIQVRSEFLNPDWKGNLMMLNPEMRQITRAPLLPKGSTFKGGEADVVFEFEDSSTEISKVLEDANGDLIVLAENAIYRIGKKKEDLEERDFRGSYIDWDNAEPEKIALLLGSDFFVVRDRAITELASRGEQSLPELENILVNPQSSSMAKRNAVWTLSRMRFSGAVDLIFAALAESDPSVVQSACNAIAATRSWQVIRENDPDEAAIEFERNDKIGEVLARLVLNSTPAVSRSAASALGVMGDPNAVEALLRVAGRPRSDRFLKQAAIQALIDIGEPADTRIGLDSGNEGQVVAALSALNKMPNGNLEPLEVISRLDSEKEKVRLTAVEIASQHHEWDAAIVNRFLEWEKPNAVQKSTMELLIPKFLHLEPMQKVIAELEKRIAD